MGQEVLQSRLQPSGVDSVGWRAITEAGPLIATREVAKEASRHPLCSHLVLKATGKVSKLHEWVPPEPTKNQSYHVKQLCSLILQNNNEPFLNL